MMQVLGTTGAVPQRSWRPKVDLAESDSTLEIAVELAGVDPEAISVQFSPERHAVVLRGKREPDAQACSLRCYQLEVLYGEFERIVNLPDVAVDRNGIKARYANGMLYISVPKREETPRRRKVPIEQE
jgi:HSP20 family protein